MIYKVFAGNRNERGAVVHTASSKGDAIQKCKDYMKSNPDKECIVYEVINAHLDHPDVTIVFHSDVSPVIEKLERLQQ